MKPPGPVLRRSGYVVETAPWGMAHELFRAYHYTRGGPQTMTYRHGLFARDNPMDLLGIAVWMTAPIPVAMSLEEPPADVLTLSRLVVVPGMPTNAASFLLSGSIRLIRADQRYRVLVTYADEAQGHTGAIYRATNWDYLGTTKGAAGGGWIDADGRRVDRRGMGWRTEDDMRAKGCTPLPKSVKHKFVIRFPERCAT